MRRLPLIIPSHVLTHSAEAIDSQNWTRVGLYWSPTGWYSWPSSIMVSAAMPQTVAWQRHNLLHIQSFMVMNMRSLYRWTVYDGIRQRAVYIQIVLIRENTQQLLVSRQARSVLMNIYRSMDCYCMHCCHGDAACYRNIRIWQHHNVHTR